MTTVLGRIAAYLEDAVFGVGLVRVLVDMYSAAGSSGLALHAYSDISSGSDAVKFNALAVWLMPCLD